MKRWGVKRLKELFAVVVITGVVINIALWNISSLHFPEDDIDPSSLRTIRSLSPSNINPLDNEWIGVMRSGRIKKIESFHNGLSLKYIAYFSTGHQAMIKLIEPISLFHSLLPPSHSTVDFFSRKEEEYSRADRLYQGWPEVAAFYLDRAIGFNKKPPITGRVITNKILFTFDNSFSTKLNNWVGEYNIGVSVHGWVEGLSSRPPSSSAMKFLSRHSPLSLSLLPLHLPYYLDISDSLLFDFLVDDHDKKHDFNWKATREGMNLHWDSGLGFRHGPIGRRKCLDIFCGSTKWIEQNEKNVNWTVDMTCQRISIFRRETIDLLRSLSPSAPYEERLSTKWKKLMENDPLYPIFQYGTYFEGPGTKAWRAEVHFMEENFLKGLDAKLELLFEYIGGLIEQYGDEFVLLSSGSPNTFPNKYNSNHSNPFVHPFSTNRLNHLADAV